MDKLLAVFDTDVLYASRLMEYLKEADWKSFEIILFTKRESLLDFLQYQTLDILLYGEEDFPKAFPKDNIKYVFCLCKDRRFARDKEEMIFKYQAASKIASDIISRYSRLEDKRHKAVYEDVRLISVFAPVPGAEKTSFAWSLAKALSDIRKVLFISFEQLATAFILKDEITGQSMSELLYHLKEDNTNHITELGSYLNYWERLSYISETSHGFDLLSLNSEDIVRFIDGIKEQKEHEIIIFFLGIYTEASMDILKISDELYIASCDLPYEELVAKEWERQMELAGIDVNQLKLHRIKLPTGEQVIGPNPLPEHIYSVIRPVAEKVASHIFEE